MDEDDLYIKFVGHEETYNFVVDEFSFDHLWPKIVNEASIFWNSFFFQIVLMIFDGKLTKNQSCRYQWEPQLSVDDFFISNHLLA